MRWALAVTLASIVAACGDDGAGPRVSGEAGYVRCLAADAPAPRNLRVGATRLAIEDRRLRVEGLPRAAKVAVFRGPIDASAVRALPRPHLAVVLGDIASSRADADASLASLAALETPVLLIAGGADRSDALRDALAALEGPAKDRLVDATALRSIRIGSVEIVPLAGAPDGRYAISSEACGFAADDLDDVADALGAPEHGVKRYLFSWAAAEGEGAASPSRGIGGVEAGSSIVRAFATRIGAVGEVFAWPAESPTPSQDDPLRLAIGPLAGPWVGLADGTRRPPGATLLTLGPDGLAAADDSP